MSNYTDGKKALAAGEFEVASKKLINALDKRPDDGGLWWALFLCKNNCRTDDELKDKLIAEYERAADEGRKPPENPFDSTYAENAFAFDKTGKRRTQAEELYSELSELWHKKRGKPLKPFKAAAAFKPVNRFAVLYAAVYIAVVIAAVGSGLIVYAVYAAVRWALWTGFVVFIAGVAAVLGIGYALKRNGKKAGAGFALLLAVFTVFAAALLIVGLNTGTMYAVILSAVVLVAVIVFCMFKVFPKGGKSGEKNARGGSRGSSSDVKSVKIKKPRTSDGYKDDFD